MRVGNEEGKGIKNLHIAPRKADRSNEIQNLTYFSISKISPINVS